MRLSLPPLIPRAALLVLVCLWAGHAWAQDKLVISGEPTVVAAGGSISSATVKVETSTGGTTTSTASIKLAITGPNSYSESVTQSATRGTDAFTISPSWTLATAGTYTLTASSSGLTSGTATITVPASSYTLPSTAVGSSSTAQTITFGFTAATTVKSVAVLFEGAASLDFTESGTSACGTQAQYSTCTVSVIFSPKAMGLRRGAVELLNASGTILQTIFISGIGTGSGVNFRPSSQTSIGTLTGYPDALAFDAKGDLYIADYDSSGDPDDDPCPSGSNYGRVVEVPVGSNGTLNTAGQTVVSSGLNCAAGLAFDGAGNLYVSDYDQNEILEVPAGSSTATTVLSDASPACNPTSSTSCPLYNPNGLAMDGAGDLFIADYDYGRVVEIPSQNGSLNWSSPTYFYGTTTPFENPAGVKVDAAGDLFIADFGDAAVFEIPYQNGALNPSAQAALLSDPVGQPSDVALDAAGNLYVALETSSQIEVIPNQGGTYNPANGYIVAGLPFQGENITAYSVSASALQNPDAVLVDGAGNIYFCDTYNGFAYELNTTTPPSLSFGSVGIGVTSAAQTVPVLSLGTQPLSINSVAFGTNFPNQGSTCTGTLAAGQSCDITASFAPTALGVVSQSAVISDNAVNLTSTTQTVGLSGTGVQGPQAINFVPVGTFTYGAAAVTLSATGGASGNPVTFSLVSGPATLSGSTLTITGVGTVVVAANQAGSTLYLAAPQVEQTITVVPAVLTVTPANATMTYGTAVPSFTYAITGYVNGDTSAVVTGAPTLTTSATSNSVAGSYAIVANQGTLAVPAGNYTFAFASGVLSVTAATPSISWTPPTTTMAYGTPLATAEFNATSPVAGTWGYTVNGKPVAPGTVLSAGNNSVQVEFYPNDKTDYVTTTLTETIVVSPAVISVTASPVSMTYGTAVPALTAYTLSGFTNGDTVSVVSGTPSLSTTATTSSKVGSYPINVSVAGMSAANYTFAGVAGTLTIGQATPATSWTPTTASTFSYGTTLAGFMDATSPVAGTWTYGFNSSVVPASTVLNAGRYSVFANFQPQDSTDYIPVQLYLPVTVQQVPLEVVANNVSMSPGSAVPALTYSFVGFVNGDGPSAVIGTPTLATTATSASVSGTYPITVSVVGMNAQNYTLSAVNGTLTMTYLPTTVTWKPSSGTIGYGTNLASVLIATGSTGAALIYTTTVNGATATLTSATVLPAGSYTLTATLPQDPTHSSSTATYALTVAPAPLAVTVANASRAYGAANPNLTGTVTGIVNGDAITASYSTAAVAGSSVGTYPITATLSPSSLLANYTVTNTPGTLTVTAAPLTVTVASANRTYGAANPALTGTVTGIVNGDAITASYSTTATTGSGVGTYPIMATLSGPTSNYVVTNTPGTLTVTPAPLMVTVANATRLVGAANPAFTGTITGLVNGDTVTATYTTTATSSSPAGTYPITAMLSPASVLANYTVTIINGTLTVAPAEQVITFPAIANQIFIGTPLTITLGATASSGLPVSYAVTGPATVSGSTLTVTNSGTVTVTASQAGGDGYPAATPVADTFTVSAGLGFGFFATSTACGSLNLSGNIIVDSYDSSQGVYPAGQANDGANAGTNGNANLSGSSTVYGALYDPNGNTQGACSGTGAKPSLTTSGTASFTGGITALAQVLTYPTPAAPSPAPPTTAQTVDYSCNGVAGCTQISGGQESLAPGQYGNLAINGGASVQLSAGTYNFNSLQLGGGATLDVTSGPVVVNLAGSGVSGTVLEINNGVIITNTIPADLQFLYAGSLNVDVSGGAVVPAVIYAPNAPVTFSGGGAISGAIVGSTITGSGGVPVHYDRALASIAASGGGTAPVAVSPSSLDFGSVPANTTSSALSVTVTNTGTTTLTISNASVSAGFALSGSCPTVAAGASCSIGVTFTPTASGTVSGTLTFTDNVGSGSQTVNLAGVGTAAGASLSPTSLTFAATIVGTTSFTQTVTLTNTGNVALTGIVIPAQVGDFSVADTGSGACGSSLAASASCSFSVAFTPAAAGAESATLQVQDILGVQLVTLAGTGALPGVALSGTQISFGSETVGIASSAQTITLSNTSAVAVTIASISATAMFSENDNCVGTLAAGASCTINVSFDPTTAATEAGSVTIVDNAPTSPQTIALTGTGVVGLGVSPSSFNFGAQEAGTTSPQETINVTNTGNVPLTLSQFQTSGAFAVSQNLCKGALAAGASCQVFVTFTPTAPGTNQGSLTITDSTGVVSATVVLMGQGTYPGIAASPANLSFGGEVVGKTSSAQTVTVTNTGNATLTIQSLTVNGDFAVSGTTCLGSHGAAATVAPGATCTVSVDMTPTSYGARTGSLLIYNNADGDLTVALSGTGDAANVVLSPSQLSFGSQPIPSADSSEVTLTGAAQTVTLSNNGNETLSLTSIAAPGGFTESSNCGRSVAAGASCSISVTFAPTALGQWTGNLTITDNAPSPTQTVALNGTGSPNGLVLNPSVISFGGYQYGHQSESESATLTNNTGQSVQNLSITASGQFNQTNNCGGTLANGASCTIKVTATPQYGGQITGSIAISGTLGGTGNGSNQWLLRVAATGVGGPAANLAAIALTAYGNTGGLNSAPTILSFGAEPVGLASSTQTLTITNTNAAGVSGVTVASTPDFPVGANTCGALAVGATCQVTVAFQPVAAGTRSGTLMIADAQGDQAAVALSGSGNGGALTAAPGLLSFAAVPQGSQAAAQTLLLSNTGTSTIALQSLSLSNPDFAIASSTCGALPATLAADATCALAVTFRPSTASNETASLTLASNASNNSVTVGLAGAVMPALQIAPASLNFGNQGFGETATNTVTLTNASATAVPITSIAAGGDFSQTNNCGAAVLAGTSCQVQVTLTTSAVGSRAGTLTVTDAAATQSVPLSGTGTDFSLGSAPAAQTVDAGGSATYSIPVIAGAFSGPVKLACSGAPAGAFCSVSPATLTLTPGNTAYAGVTVTTQSRALLPVLPSAPRWPRPTPWVWMMLALAALGLLLAQSRLRRSERVRFGILGAILTAALAAGACGGVGNYSSAGNGTPAGAYTITITVSAGANVHTTTVTLNVN